MHRNDVYFFISYRLFCLCVYDVRIRFYILQDYDAFVSYSHEDYAWVVQELRPYLEDQDPAFRLCLHDRDFMAGAAVADNICCAVKTSRRMILVLSKAFLRSHWCHLEFRQAHYKASEISSGNGDVIFHERYHGCFLLIKC